VDGDAPLTAFRPANILSSWLGRQVVNDETAARDRRLFDSPVTWKGRAVRVTVPGVLRGLRPLRTSSSEGHAGAQRSRAPGGGSASCGASKTPGGAGGPASPRRFSGWSNTLGRRSDASWFAQTPRTQAREGTSGGESPCDGLGSMCSEGGSAALEPRPWDQGGR